MLIKICRMRFRRFWLKVVGERRIRGNIILLAAISLLTPVFIWHILINTCPTSLLEEALMNDSRKPSKQEMLRMRCCLNPHPLAVRDELFGSDEFFDPYDLPQVKYEMLRRVRHDNRSVSDAASNFGFSRVSFYQAQAAFQREGLTGLLPQKRGPKDRHKLTEDVMRFVKDVREREETIGPVSLAQRIEERFKIRVHPRSVQRALAAQKKKLPDGRENPAGAG